MRPTAARARFGRRCGIVPIAVAVLALAAACGPRRTITAPTAAPRPVEARLAAHGFPRLAVQVQLCCRSEETAALFDRLPRWDLAIVDAETVATMPEYLGPAGRIRRENADAVVLGYFSAGDVIPELQLPIYSRYRSGLQPSWLLHDAAGRPVPLFELAPGTWTTALDLTTHVGRYMPEFLRDHVLSTGRLDGIFFDWAATSVSWLNHRAGVAAGRVDLGGDGVPEPDAALDRRWRQAFSSMAAYARRVFPRGALLVGNAGWNTGLAYADRLNGIMIEQFLEGEGTSPAFGWSAVMRTYAFYATEAVRPRVSLVMANRDDAGDVRFMRFALASTLMFDGYFAFANRSKPTAAYQVARWYDEYAVDRDTGRASPDARHKGFLGRPLGPAYSVGSGARLAAVLAGGDRQADTIVWRRDFEHGCVLVNPASDVRTVDVGAGWQRISGTDVDGANDGAAVETLALAPRTGVLLLRRADAARPRATASDGRSRATPPPWRVHA